MNPEPVIRAAIELVQAQLRLGALLTRALLGMRQGNEGQAERTNEASDSKSVERAAAAIRHEMLRHKDVGFASLLRTNFPPDEIRRIARAALEAASFNGQESSMGSAKGSGQTCDGKPNQSEEARQREQLAPRGVPGKGDEAEDPTQY